MKRLFAILLCVIFALLTACGGEDDTPVSNKEHSAANVDRIAGDYDSVPTVTRPAVLSESEMTTVKIRTSPDDPYSKVISEYYDGLAESQNFNAIESIRYYIHDINGDGIDELFIGRISVLGGVDVYDSLSAREIEPVYGILIEAVYSIENGAAVRQNEVIIGNQAYETEILSNGLLKILCRTPRNPQIAYVECKDRHFSEVICLSKSLDEKYECEYYENGQLVRKVITEEEFNRRIAEIEDGAHPVELEWRHLQDYGK